MTKSGQKIDCEHCKWNKNKLKVRKKLRFQRATVEDIFYMQVSRRLAPETNFVLTNHCNVGTLKKKCLTSAISSYEGSEYEMDI